MKIKTFVVASTGDRFESIMLLLRSLDFYLLNGWNIIIVGQKYSADHLDEIKRFLSAYNGDNVVLNFDDYLGAHSAKVYALNNYKSDIWCSLDDDMELVAGLTNYGKIVSLLEQDKSIGFISGNWARTREWAIKKGIKDELIRQKLVYTGGGLLFRDDVADVVRSIPDEEYLFDDCLWAVYAYINGYDNYRYRGSVVAHKICAKGGRRTWLAVATNKKKLPPENILRVRKGNTNKIGYDEYLICVEKDVTDYAKELHMKNIKSKG